jgi:hypothetical protein
MGARLPRIAWMDDGHAVGRKPTRPVTAQGQVSKDKALWISSQL